MAKNNMKLKVKSPKRERNKKVELTKKEETFEIVKVFVGIIIFLGLFYGLMVLMTKAGLFEKGYTAPTKEDVEIDTDYIAIGTVFTKPEKNYYVLFDDYETDYSSNAYIETILSKLDNRVYKVDMSSNENKKFASTEENKKASSAEELKINGITLIKIKNGKIDKYISGSEAIEEYINK